MDLQAFGRWYRSLSLMPFSMDVVNVCTHQPYCTYCPLRCGCPIRPLFYLDDMSFEIGLQRSEIKTNKEYSNFTPTAILENEVFAGTQRLRVKRTAELRLHPDHSFT